MRGYLFVCGCPRSGTTALAWLLNRHPAIAIGAERFITCAFPVNGEGLSPSLFDEDRFFDIREGDTFYSTLQPEYYGELRLKYLGASWVGDKSPPLVYLLDRIEELFGRAHVIVVVRDIVSVASSYQARAANEADLSWSSDRDYRLAVKEWNDANRLALEFLKIPDRKTTVTVVDYADLFLNDICIAPLFEALGLSDRPARAAYFRARALSKKLKRTRRSMLTEDQLAYVKERADVALAEDLLGYKLLFPEVVPWLHRLRSWWRL